MRQIVQRVVGDQHRLLFLCAKARGGVLQPLADIRVGQRLELKHRAARKQGVIDIKIRVLGGGGDQRDGTLLHTFQQALLLALVEILNLVQIQQNAAACPQRADIRQHGLDIGGAGGGAVELVQLHTAARGNDAGHRGFAHAGGTVKDHIGDFAAVHRAAEHLIFAQKMLLPADFVQRAGTQTLC